MNDDKRRLISEKNQIEKELEIEKRIYAKALDAFNISSITESPETMNRSYDLLFILDVTQSNCQSIFDEAEDLAFEYNISNRKKKISYSCIVYPESGQPYFRDFTEEIEIYETKWKCSQKRVFLVTFLYYLNSLTISFSSMCTFNTFQESTIKLKCLIIYSGQVEC